MYLYTHPLQCKQVSFPFSYRKSRITLTCKGKIQRCSTKIQIQIRFHLPNERLESLENFAVFLCKYKHGLCLYIYGSLQVVSCDP